MVPQIDAKSIKNDGVLVERFWSGPWAPKGIQGDILGCHSAAILEQKSKKGYPKRHAEFNPEKVFKINAKCFLK